LTTDERGPKIDSVARRHLALSVGIDLYTGELARRGRSKGTRRTYERVLFLLADRYPDRSVAELTADDCRRTIERSPMERIRRPPRRRPEDLDVVTLTKEDVQRLFDYCDDWQELLCLSVLAFAGPRRGAAARVRWKDANLLHGTVRFVEKGGKVTTKPIPDRLGLILRAAVDHRDVPTQPNDYLIPNRRAATVKGPERSSKVIWETIRRIAARAGVQAHVHAIRAAFAVH
jgi:integrase